MNGYVTDLRLRRVLHLPIALSQTELKAGRSLLAASFTLTQGQRLELRALTLNVLRVLTSGVVPDNLYTSHGLCSVGLYCGAGDCGPLVLASVTGSRAAAVNTFSRTVVEAPGEYRVLVINHAANLDLSVSITGAVKIHR